MIDESFGGDDDEVDANFYGRSNTSSSPSKLLTSVPLGKWLLPLNELVFSFAVYLMLHVF